MAKKKLTKEEKKMKHAQAVSGNGERGPSPYYPTDYTKYKRNPKKEEKPMIETARPLTTKQWIGILIVIMIPLVNLIALICWSSKKNEKVNPSKRSFARAYLLIWLICVVIAVIIGVAFFFLSSLLFPFPASADEAVATLEEAGYAVESTDFEDYTQVYAISEDGNDYVTIYYYNDTAKAEEYFESLDAESEEELIYGLSDNAVYVGTNNAVEAINGTSLF